MRLVLGVAMTILSSGPALGQAAGPAVSVDPAAGQHAISPYIYGMAEYGVSPTFQAQARLGVLRWGGDGTTRYNWMVDSSNAGFDWYFMGGDGVADPVPSAGPDALVKQDVAAKSATLLTIPIIPFINRSSAWSCSFPTSVYGAQQSTNPYVHPDGEDCGNSISSAGAQLSDTDVLANHVANAPAIQQAWVAHLVAAFGQARHGGVAFYQLDNEPYGWGNTHRDVMPGGTTYATIASLGAQYAAAVKRADPSAKVLGPSDFTLGGWIGSPGAQGGLYAGQYYLQQMAASAAAHKIRLLDYFDEHYYFNFTDAASQLASTRTLWDPAYNGGTWVEQYYFDGPMMLIPRFKAWIAQYYPGTKLAISEYSIDSGHKLVTDALAEADVLGIFGREGVDLATMWSPPAATDPIAFSFLLYRNVAGEGQGFGATSVQTVSADQGVVSAYGALRNARTLTLVLINKSAGALSVPLSVAGQTGRVSAVMYGYSGADLTAIHRLANVVVASGAAQVPMPGYSMALLVVPLSAP
jgi:hypothetical protein